MVKIPRGNGKIQFPKKTTFSPTKNRSDLGDSGSKSGEKVVNLQVQSARKQKTATVLSFEKVPKRYSTTDFGG